MEIARETIFFGAFRRAVENWDPESPIVTRIIRPHFTDGRLYTFKQAGKRIYFGFYVPVFLIFLTILYILWRILVAFLCRR